MREATELAVSHETHTFFRNSVQTVQYSRMLQVTRSVLLSLRGAANHMGIAVIRSARPIASSAHSQARQMRSNRSQHFFQRSECGMKTATLDRPDVRTTTSAAAAVDLASVADVEAPDRQRQPQSERPEASGNGAQQSPTMQVSRKHLQSIIMYSALPRPLLLHMPLLVLHMPLLLLHMPLLLLQIPLLMLHMPLLLHMSLLLHMPPLPRMLWRSCRCYCCCFSL